MKKITTIVILVLMGISLSSCIGDKANATLLKMGLKDKSMQRIVITNNRYAGRYTIIDKRSIDDFTKLILNSKDATVDSKLEPDFIFEFFDETKNVATFKYIVGIDDNKTANLIDTNGKLYRVSPSIEDGFMKRLMKRDNSQNIPEYYISLIKLLIEKTNIKKGDTVVVDISKDYVVTRSITSVEQKSILDSIDSKGARIVFPNQVKHSNYTIRIDTSKYTDDTSNAIASVTDKNNAVTRFEIVGTFGNGDWNYHIKYK